MEVKSEILREKKNIEREGESLIKNGNFRERNLKKLREILKKNQNENLAREN